MAVAAGEPGATRGSRRALDRGETRADVREPVSRAGAILGMPDATGATDPVGYGLSGNEAVCVAPASSSTSTQSIAPSGMGSGTSAWVW